MEGPAERYAYVAALAPDQKSRSDALILVDVDPASQSYGEVAGQLNLAYRPLRSGRDLCQRAWCTRWDWARWNLPSRSL
jgi:hypothetical protein